MTRGIVIAAPRSGSGKTLVTLGLAAALRNERLGAGDCRCVARTLMIRGAVRHVEIVRHFAGGIGSWQSAAYS